MTYKDIKNIRKIAGLQNENKQLKYLNWVMFVICFLLICLLTGGCKSKQSIIGTSSQSHTNTTVTTLFKDTVIDVHFPIQLPVFTAIPVQDTFTSDTAFAENSTAKAMAFLVGGELHLTLSAKDTTIPIHIPNAIRETTTNQTTTTNETTVVEQNKKRFGDTLVERILILLGVV
ncbi:MAG: hypothetical protein FWG79_09865, partial [Bacteroidales bacterium]|nr:hypothetical protein [Bacteroidales bacterium]